MKKLLIVSKDLLPAEEHAKRTRNAARRQVRQEERKARLEHARNMIPWPRMRMLIEAEDMHDTPPRAPADPWYDRDRRWNKRNAKRKERIRARTFKAVRALKEAACLPTLES